MTLKKPIAGGRAMVRLLRMLARADAYAEAETDEAGEVRCVRVLNGARGAEDVVHHASGDVWGRAVAAGLVVASGPAGSWRISEAGRRQVSSSQGEAVRLNRSMAGTVQGAPARGPSSSAPQENLRESPLAWLYRRRDRSGGALISDAQFQAGERLRADFETGQLMPRLTVDWQRAATGGARCPPGTRGLDLGERALAARQRVSDALGAVGPELARVLVDVCCHLKGLEQLEKAAGWPQRSGKIVLQVALSALARHYGLDRIDRDAARRSHGPVKVLHWGADGYRPQTVTVRPEREEG